MCALNFGRLAQTGRVSPIICSGAMPHKLGRCAYRKIHDMAGGGTPHNFARLHPPRRFLDTSRWPQRRAHELFGTRVGLELPRIASVKPRRFLPVPDVSLQDLRLDPCRRDSPNNLPTPRPHFGTSASPSVQHDLPRSPLRRRCPESWPEGPPSKYDRHN